MANIFFPLIFTVLLLRVDGYSYCDVCPDHTMCIYSGVSSLCGAGSSGVSSAEQQQIVNYHNELRAKVANGQESRGYPGPQPSASNMKRLVWDSELATIAQRWADQCTFQHDHCRNTLSNTYVGQNLASTSSSVAASADWTYAIDMWYDEVSKYNGNNVGSFSSNDMAAGHYTQVVWGDTSRIGCGRRQYQSGGWYTHIYVCNYAKGGNFISSPVYTVGTPCSSCASSCSNGLCA